MRTYIDEVNFGPSSIRQYIDEVNLGPSSMRKYIDEVNLDVPCTLLLPPSLEIHFIKALCVYIYIYIVHF